MNDKPAEPTLRKKVFEAIENGIENGYGEDYALIEDQKREIERLREALKPFAMEALTRNARTTSDDEPVTVTMGMCRKAQQAMAAD